VPEITDQPIFLSVNAKKGYWTVVFPEGDSPKVYDGEPRDGGNFFILNEEGTLVERSILQKRAGSLNDLLVETSIFVMSDIINDARILFENESEGKSLGEFLLLEYIPFAISKRVVIPSCFILSCINNIDFIFSQAQMRTTFINQIDGLGRSDILEIFINKFDIFSQEEK
jgi:hypothetical protein